MAMYRAFTVCNCRERVDATNSNTFRWSHELGGWWWSDTPTRTVKWNAPQENKDFPYIHTICDYCGHPLPGVVFRDDPSPGQADGNRGSEDGG
jgi:hypothetical protein